MRRKLVLAVACLTVASSALAQGLPSSNGLAVTAKAAKKAFEVRFPDGNRKNILEIDPGPSGSLAAVEIVDGSFGFKVPGNTITAGDNVHQLDTSLTLKQVEGRS